MLGWIRTADALARATGALTAMLVPAAVLLLHAAPLSGQSIKARLGPVPWPDGLRALPVTPAAESWRIVPYTDDPALAMLASAAVPGTGQAMLGQLRWFPYVATEIWAWFRYAGHRRDARALERRYKDLAWSVARRVSQGERRDTVFEYYEALARFDASGAFDADPAAPGVQPESDLETFNGQLWQLARQLFLPGGASFPVGSVEYERALEYYLDRAVPPGYAWSWGASRLEQQHFGELIRGSDEAFRDATLVLGVIIANHIVSAVDALVSARLRGSAGDLRIRSRLEPGGRPGEFRITTRVSW